MERKNFAKPSVNIPLPNLIQIQTESYDWLFKEGIRELLNEISPVEDFSGKVMELEFKDYSLEQPKYDEPTSRNKNLTYKAPLRCRVVLTNKLTGKTKESDVFLGDFPLMTPRGTFIINGIERVVVSQIVRSYGVLFVNEESNGRKLFGAKIIPSRGAWLEFETNSRDVISVKVDRKRKIPVSTFLRILGMNDPKEIMEAFKDVDTNKDHQYIKTTIERDPAQSYEEALVEVYKRIRPGDLATPESAKLFLDAIFFNPKRYDLGKVGRYKINQRLELNTKDTTESRVLCAQDVVEVIKEIIRLNNDPQAVEDDIDHLKNRRIRAVGELVQGRLRVGLLRMERIIKDRMSVLDPETVTPAQLINSRPIAAVMQEFFASSQLCQFMDQTNPLAELEHKRRLAATGPGGLSRERAGFEVRDVHRSHYGRICPITTPEGPNIGLVSQLATYARINEYGFIESPYLKVVKDPSGKMKVTKEIVYLDAAQEDKFVIAPGSTEVNDKGFIIEPKNVVRVEGDPIIDNTDKIQYIDVSPKQTVSVTASLIPFIEHDDATRASMGSNMERQAVPTIKSQAPVIGTGMETAVHDSGQLVIASEDGEVISADASTIVVKTKDDIKTYQMRKFVRSNQATSINQKPIVYVGDKVKKGQVIADSSATENGELALGQNVLCAYMAWGGANYEDAIILSERLVHDDRYTSIHIEKYSIEVRDTKLGPEEITRDIPNVGEEALANLDEQGIIRIGAEITAGDILVGKITPKGEAELSAEEKLLRAIFGEKAKDVKDTSLRLPHGERGKVVDIKIFDKREKGDELPAGVNKIIELSIAHLRKISVGDKLAGRHGNKGVIAKILPVADMPFLADGTPIDIILNPLGVVSRMNIGQLLETHLGWAAHALGYRVASPIFESVKIDEMKAELKKAGLPEDGKTQLYDGRTGDPFDQKTTVGINYILKLIHLVDDKMHARSTGPYSMVTQQPLGGKAQFGGQRFGEMEVWALEGYGAAHTLQEMITIKSDDVVGRSRAYESIIRGEEIQKPSIPAAFHVLVRELQSLGLSVDILTEEEIELPDEREKIAMAAQIAEREKKLASTDDHDHLDDEIIEEEHEDSLVTELLSNQEVEPPIASPDEVMDEE